VPVRSQAAHLTGPGQVADTHLLNLAIARGGRLVTFDQGIGEALSPKNRRSILELR
jgi:predicted unusual protein kinase regulating ubiquinone biosynthesis (AarF/ABC1/UbiB family)